jgi:P27 family predicted phage terminase small subunit
MASTPGRRPTPTNLKLLRGNPGKRPINTQEPRPKVEAPSCPPHLGEIARAEWRRMVKEMRPLNLLTRLDRAALAIYCDQWERWVMATEELRKYGPVLKMGTMLVTSPYIGIADKAMNQIRAIGTEFGFTPSARTRLHVSPSQKHGDPNDPLFSVPIRQPRG